MRFLKTVLTGAAAAACIAAVPASACMTVMHMVTIHPVYDTSSDIADTSGDVYKIRYDGERAGRQDRLWPNYYVVEILDGEHAGKKARIPAHVTSCHSVAIEDGAQGFVKGALRFTDKNGKKYGVPILSTWMNGRKVSYDTMFLPKSAE